MCGYKKNRVITKAVVAAGSGQNTTLPATLADQRCRVFRMLHVNHQTLETCGALFFRRISQCIQQFFKVGLVAGAFTGKACRVDARCAIQCVYLKAGVIGNRRQSGMLCGIACLQDGILDKGPSTWLISRTLPLLLLARTISCMIISYLKVA